MTELWNELGHRWLAVDDRAALGLWIRLGGHALVEVSLAHASIPEKVRTREVAPDGPTGFLFDDSLSARQLKHRPPRSLRARIFERDHHACRRCGCTTLLTRHQVLAHQHGGLTQKNNLITLCRRCHDDCDPDDEVWYPSPDLQAMLLADELDTPGEDYDAAVRRHRRLVERLIT